MSEVTFDEPEYSDRTIPTYQVSNTSESKGIMGLLMSYGFAKSRTEANIVMLVIAVIVIVVSVIIYVMSNGRPRQMNTRMSEWMAQGHVGPVAPDFMPNLK